ncbi:fructokinase-like 2 protein, chloroplastic [Tanacetum coccineum]
MAAALPSFTQFSSLTRWQSNLPSVSSINFIQFPEVRLRSRFVITAIPRKKLAENTSDGEESDTEKKTTRKRAPTRRKKKVESEVPAETPILESSITNMDEDTLLPSEPTEPVKPQRRGRKKETAVASTSSTLEEEPEKKVTRRRRTKKKVDDTIDEGSETELSDPEEDTDNEKELEIDATDVDDISFTYAWPPLICCFGPVQHAFVPSGRPANRLIDHESHERMKDALWTPEKFVRAPGGSAADVALCLTKFGSNAAVMGKIGDDDFGQALLLHLNESRVQTRSIRIDPKRTTAVSRMKMSKRGGLRTTCLIPCAEDALKKSEINIDVLKEAKIFYFNSFSLLDRKTKTSALQAIKISKQFGGLIFFDLNLPLPLWYSREETYSIILEALELADIVEVTKQELEFLCGITPSERFDTNDNDRSKFVHYSRDMVSPILHDNLELLFVTNGTSKIHYYTKEQDGSVLGTEDVPITPFTSDMSAAGDGIVAGSKHVDDTLRYRVGDDDFFPDPNGFKTINEKAYRTLLNADGDDSEDLGITVNRRDGDDSEDEGDNTEGHGDYDSEDIDDMETDDEEPVRKVRQAIRA